MDFTDDDGIALKEIANVGVAGSNPVSCSSNSEDPIAATIGSFLFG
jgi:hypothetical protein